jgi:hypothetical protein
MEDNPPYPVYRGFNGGLLSCKHETRAIRDLKTGVKLNHIPRYRKPSKAPPSLSGEMLEVDITLKRRPITRA